MAQLMWALACARVLTDRESNTVTYIEAIEGISVPAPGFPCPLFFVGTDWKRTADTVAPVRVRVRILSPGGSEILGAQIPDFYFAEGARHHRINLQVGGFPLTESGEYYITGELFSGDTWVPAFHLPIDIEVPAQADLFSLQYPLTPANHLPA
jgi:hypothetical protein